MKNASLEKMFNPNSIAVIGASNQQGSVGFSLMKNLIGSGFRGTVYPVNPKRKSVLGIHCYASVLDVPASIDLAIVATPARTVPGLVRQCVEAKAKSLIIVSSGFSEIGAEGIKLERELAGILRGTGIRVLGPNCLGFIRPDRKINASFAIRNALPGKMALISQSGALCSGILDWAQKKKVGFKYFISIGSMLDVNFSDLIEFLEQDEEVESIAMYMESIKDAGKFLRVAKKFSKKRPIMVAKSGRFEESAKTAISHTGSMAGNDEVFEAAFLRARIVRIASIQDLLGAAEALAKQNMPKGKRLAVLTNAGGPGVMASDAIMKNRLGLARLSRQTMKSLEKAMPLHWSRGNPVDILGDAGPDLYDKALEILLKDKGIDGILVILSPQAISRPLEVAKAVAKRAEKKRKAVLGCWLGETFVEEGRKYIRENGIPCYRSPEEAVRAFSYMNAYREILGKLEEDHFARPKEMQPNMKKIEAKIRQYREKGRLVMTECDSKQILEEYGIPVNQTLLAGNAKEAVKRARQIGFPVVLKVVSEDITHKTDAGGIALGLSKEKEVEEAFERITRNARKAFPKARVLGVNVQKMVPVGKAELILGKKTDSIFGPVILFGSGGITTEILGDKTLELPPINKTLAGRMVRKTKISKLFLGPKARVKLNVRELEDILVRFSHFAADFPEIQEVDINPLIVSKGKLFAVDARMILSR